MWCTRRLRGTLPCEPYAINLGGNDLVISRCFPGGPARVDPATVDAAPVREEVVAFGHTVVRKF